MVKFNQNAWFKPCMNTNRDLRKKAKNDFEKDFLGWWIIQFLGKLLKMWESIEIQIFSQQKKEETISCQNQIFILQCFSQKSEMLLNKPHYLGLSIL